MSRSQNSDAPQGMTRLAPRLRMGEKGDGPRVMEKGSITKKPPRGESGTAGPWAPAPQLIKHGLE